MEERLKPVIDSTCRRLNSLSCIVLLLHVPLFVSRETLVLR